MDEHSLVIILTLSTRYPTPGALIAGDLTDRQYYEKHQMRLVRLILVCTRRLSENSNFVQNRGMLEKITTGI